MPTTALGWTALASVTAAGVGAYTAVESKRQAEKAESQAKKQWQVQQQRELEAGEYFEELTSQQMELQAQSSNIKTLANLIEQQSQPPVRQIITLPPAEEYSAVEQINQAFDRFFRG